MSHCGGISELHRIAALAETYDVALAPHAPIGPISLAACMQVDLVVPNCEYPPPLLFANTCGSSNHGQSSSRR